MISEFIDGLLNFHFLQNALITLTPVRFSLVLPSTLSSYWNCRGCCWLFYYSERDVTYG